MKTPEQVIQLLSKYQQGLCTEEEQGILESWYNLKVAQNSGLKITDDLTKARSLIWDELDQMLPAQKPALHRRLYFRMAVAAAMISIVFGIALFYTQKDPKINPKPITALNDILPGTEGATLTLANGTKVALSAASNGKIAQEDGVSISKNANGKLVYTLAGPGSSSSAPNTLSTAKGQTYELNLPDGSKVILNAASSLTYSASLIERGLRRVKLEGEAFFQISTDQKHPFVVESKGQTVQVLGTEFNISAYGEEPVIKTTLVEGSVQIQADGVLKILKPNQQAAFSLAHGLQISAVDAEYAIAWKNGFFLFHEENLESIMNKVGRWYNLEVVYTDPSLKSRTFIGTISRFEKVSKVLNMLERTEVASFTLEGRSIVIRQKQ